MYESITAILCFVAAVSSLDPPPKDSKCYTNTPIPRARLEKCISDHLTSSGNCRPDRSHTGSSATMMAICAYDDALVRMWNYDRETPDRRLWCDAVVRRLNSTLQSEAHCKECGCCDASKECYGFRYDGIVDPDDMIEVIDPRKEKTDQ